MKTAVIGAYGYTGTLICSELEKAKVPFTAIGRNTEKLNTLQETYTCIEALETADITEKGNAKRICDTFDLIVNCAGPFTEESTALLEAVANSNVVYLDISGETGFLKNSREQYHACAKASGALIVHGCAFESLVTDLILQLYLPDGSTANTIESYYTFNQKRTSPGTRITMKLARFRTPLKIEGGNWKASDLKADQKEFKYAGDEKTYTAVPYPLPEIAYAAWNYDVQNAQSYLVLDNQEAMYVNTSIKPADEIPGQLEKLKILKKEGPTAEEREHHESTITVVLKTDNDEEVIKAFSTDMYGTTAKIISLAVKEARTGHIQLSGVQSPAKLFRNKERETLEQLNIRIEQSGIQ